MKRIYLLHKKLVIAAGIIFLAGILMIVAGLVDTLRFRGGNRPIFVTKTSSQGINTYEGLYYTLTTEKIKDGKDLNGVEVYSLQKVLQVFGKTIKLGDAQKESNQGSLDLTNNITILKRASNTLTSAIKGKIEVKTLVVPKEGKLGNLGTKRTLFNNLDFDNSKEDAYTFTYTSTDSDIMVSDFGVKRKKNGKYYFLSGDGSWEEDQSGQGISYQNVVVESLAEIAFAFQATDIKNCQLQEDENGNVIYILTLTDDYLKDHSTEAAKLKQAVYQYVLDEEEHLISYEEKLVQVMTEDQVSDQITLTNHYQFDLAYSQEK